MSDINYDGGASAAWIPHEYDWVEASSWVDRVYDWVLAASWTLDIPPIIADYYVSDSINANSGTVST